MIMIDVIIQGTLGGISGGGDFTPTPFPLYLDGNWESNLVMAAGVYDSSGDKIVLSHRSSDNGDSYVVTSEDHSFGTTISVSKLDHVPLPQLAVNNVLARRQGIFVQWKVGSSNWQEVSLSSIPGGSFGGGGFSYFGIDYTNNAFIVIKEGSGYDVFTTTDFLAYSNPITDGNANPITDSANDLFIDLYSIYYISGQYVAYGIDYDAGSGVGLNITATSTDLITWTKQSNLLPVTTFNERMFCYFLLGNRYLIFRYENNGGIPNRVLEIWSSVDGLTWTQATLPAQEVDVSVEPSKWIITASAVELLTNAYVYRSIDGTTWTRALLENQLTYDTDGWHNSSILAAHAKEAKYDLAAGPDHIAIQNVYSLQLGGKIVSLTEVNANPTLKYPEIAPHDEIVGFIQNNFSINQIVADGFAVENSNASLITIADSLYVRNTATSRYFECTVTIAGDPGSSIGARALGAESVGVASNYYSGTDAFHFYVEENLIRIGNASDIVVTHSFTAGQIIGFLFDFIAKTVIIEVDGVLLATVPNISDKFGWVIEYQVDVGGRYALNVGQESFTHNGTSATSWMTQ